MASYVDPFTSHYTGFLPSRSSKHALVGRIHIVQADRIRVQASTLSTFTLCTLVCDTITFNVSACSRSHTAFFWEVRIAAPDFVSLSSDYNSTGSTFTLNWTDSNFGVLIGTSLAPMPLRTRIH
jgi:hypothetical protein